MAHAIYVETVIRAPLDALWAASRNPAVHQRWDVRFSRIEPADGAGRFRYATRVLPGLTVAGSGVSVGERRSPGGTATSVLRFRCDHPLSLIRAGHGYWRYIPSETGVRFLTCYDYTPGWGAAGPLVDRVFRPVFGWATAWSFDRVRLWLERGISPSRTRNQALLELAVRLVLAAVDWRLGLAALLAPPLPSTPAARRCRRRPAEKSGEGS